MTVLERLNTWFDAAERVSVAASGGVDSTTLAIMAHRRLGMGCKVFHSVSPAVPPVASERLAEIAKREGWLYEVVNTGEFDDPEYLANPVNRCFFVKKIFMGLLHHLRMASSYRELILMISATTGRVCKLRTGMRSGTHMWKLGSIKLGFAHLPRR